MSDVNCPYCGESQEVCHDDGANYNEDGELNYCCNADCDKEFTICTSMTPCYTTYCEDGTHDLSLKAIKPDCERLGKYSKDHVRINCQREHCEFHAMIEKEQIPKYFTPEQLKKQESQKQTANGVEL